MQHLLWCDNFKTSSLTQRWVHYYLFVMQYFNKFIVSVLCSCSWWVISYLTHHQNVLKSKLTLIIFVYMVWIASINPYLSSLLFHYRIYCSATIPKHQGWHNGEFIITYMVYTTWTILLYQCCVWTIGGLFNLLFTFRTFSYQNSY